MKALRTPFCAVLLTTALAAHGGQYRAVTPPSPPATPTPTQPRAPLPAVPSAGTRAVTPGPGNSLTDDPAMRWQTWWEFNKDPFVQSRGVDRDGPVTGSDDFYLGTRRPVDRVDTLLATEDDKVGVIVPALAKLLEDERNRDIQSACLVALAKVGLDAPGIELEAILGARIARGDQEVRETAVLSLGIAGRAKALPLLAGLLRDDEIGRKLEDRANVSDRTRTFAAYALGLLGMRSDDAALDGKIQELLLAVLLDEKEEDRELRSAAVNAIGILGLGDASGAGKLLLWRTVEFLLDWYQKDIGRGDEVVQAHAPIAIARLLGRGNSTLHQRCKQQFADDLSTRKKRHNSVLQSSAIALGMLAEPTADDAAFVTALQRYYEDGHDRLARNLAIISLGRIGGEELRVWLLRAYERSSKGLERPWVALALGLCAAQVSEDGRGDATIVRRLVDDLEDNPNRSTQGAIAVAIGLTRHPLGLHALTRAMRLNEASEEVAGYAAVGLGLLGDRSAVAALTDVMARSQRRQFLLPQTALALGMLGDRAANTQLVEMMQQSDSVTSLAALAKAIGRIGDRRSIAPLLTILGDREAPKLSRAFVAAALGGVGDKDLLAWNLMLSVNCNYATGMDTLTNGATGVLDIL